jgi:hypothetical protein
MGGECSQKLRPWRGMSLLSGAQGSSVQRKINTLSQNDRRWFFPPPRPRLWLAHSLNQLFFSIDWSAVSARAYFPQK